MSYRRLDPDRIIDTAVLLERRIAERFPDSGLRAVAAELVALARDTRDAARKLEAPIWWLRGLVGLGIAVGALAFIFLGSLLTFDRLDRNGFSALQGIEASINTLVLAGLGLFALARLEERLKRHEVLTGLHGIRSLIHVIDMHQLTKDPIAFSAAFRPTASSPKRLMGRADLERYLDYCSEMLSLTGKVAALYAQSVNDTEVVEAVNDIENLATNLARKIWQKIMMIGPEPGAGPRPAVSGPKDAASPAPRRRRAP